MTNLQNSKLNMYVLLTDMLVDADPDALSRASLLKTKLNAISALIPLIDAASAEKLLHTYSARGSRNIRKVTLANRIMRVIKAMRVYAEISENPDLLLQFNFSKSKLVKLSDRRLLEVAKNVHAFAVANEAALIPYNCSKADAQALTVDTEMFREIAPAPRKNDLTRTSAGKRLAAFDRQAMAIVKSTDTYVETLVDVEDELYEMYKLRRPILHSSRHNQVIGRVTDAAGNPLENVMVTIEGKSFKTETTATGSFRILSLADGVHFLHFSRAGFENQIHEITITHGLKHNPGIEMREI